MVCALSRWEDPSHLILELFHLYIDSYMQKCSKASRCRPQPRAQKSTRHKHGDLKHMGRSHQKERQVLCKESSCRLPVGIFLSKLNGHPREAPLAQRLETSVGKTNCQHWLTYKLQVWRIFPSWLSQQLTLIQWQVHSTLVSSVRLTLETLPWNNGMLPRELSMYQVADILCKNQTSFNPVIFKCGPWPQRVIHLAKYIRLGSLLSGTLEASVATMVELIFRNRFVAHQTAVGHAFTVIKGCVGPTKCKWQVTKLHAHRLQTWGALLEFFQVGLDFAVLAISP